MRFSKVVYNKFRAVEFEKKFAFFPKKVQGHWIWLEAYYFEKCWLIKERIYISGKEGEMVSSLVAKWTYNSHPVLPEDTEYQKWSKDKSKLHNVLG